MKKFLAILVVALLATSFAFSQTPDGGTATGSGTFQALVITPITLGVTGEFALGNIATGDEKLVSGKYVEFAVGGHTGQPFDAILTGPVITGDADDATIHTNVPYTNSGWLNATPLTVPNNYKIEVTKLIGGAKTGNVSFKYTMTVSYSY